MRNIFLFLISFYLVGCSLEVQRGIPVDLTKKTMTVPATGWKVFGINKELRKGGWKLKVSGRDTAYRLFTSSGGLFTYISIVENKSCEMVLEIDSYDISGSELGKRIVEELEMQ